jgi:hypothetical protein
MNNPTIFLLTYSDIEYINNHPSFKNIQLDTTIFNLQLRKPVYIQTDSWEQERQIVNDIGYRILATKN